MDRPALLAGFVAASVACSGASSPAQSTRDASTASGSDSSIPVAGDADAATAPVDAGGTPDLDGAVADASTVGAYDGPVSDAACPGLPASGTWQNVSPPGSNYPKTYTGMVSVAVRTDDPAIV